MRPKPLPRKPILLNSPQPQGQNQGTHLQLPQFSKTRLRISSESPYAPIKGGGISVRKTVHTNFPPTVRFNTAEKADINFEPLHMRRFHLQGGSDSRRSFFGRSPEVSQGGWETLNQHGKSESRQALLEFIDYIDNSI